MPKFYKSSEKTGAPFSEAVEVGDLIYLSGQVHADADLNLHGETIEEKLLYVMGNVERVLAEAGLTKENIVRIQIYIVDITELPALNEQYKKYFDKHPLPVRTAIGVAALPLGANLEIDVIASR